LQITFKIHLWTIQVLGTYSIDIPEVMRIKFFLNFLMLEIQAMFISIQMHCESSSLVIAKATSIPLSGMPEGSLKEPPMNSM
jgi:hypothetical protein